jgi:fatty acid desaturase
LQLVGFADAIDALGREARAELGEADVRRFRRLKWASQAAQWSGRALLVLSGEPILWFAGALILAFHFAVEAQLMHSATHGAYTALKQGPQPRHYDTLAVPMRGATWRVAHKIHHVHPSTLDADPDTMHPLFRVHSATRWRPWHALNTLLGGLFVFETWAIDYDRFLKARALRPAGDRSELKKIALFYVYNYGLFPLLAWPHALAVVVATLAASTLRNYIFVALQTASSVGEAVSTTHEAVVTTQLTRDERAKFQVETSKNFRVRSPLWRYVFGGLDQHIEHHLWPALPPERLHALAPKVKALCDKHGVSYASYPSLLASLKDSAKHLWKLSSPRT